MEQLLAVQHIRRMRGGSQAHLMLASDGNYYVVKFQNCPQHPRVLANEFLATKIGIALGLPMPDVHVIDVPASLIAQTPGLRIEMAGLQFPCSSGLQLASRYAADLWQDQVVDHLPDDIFPKVANRHHLVQVLVFDKWAGNCDSRQAVFARFHNEQVHRMMCIDQGFCFNAGEWNFPDLPLHGVYQRNIVYRGVTGWDSFEPVLSYAEDFDSQAIWEIAREIPSEWYQHDAKGITKLVEALDGRRSAIRQLISNFASSTRKPFPNWSAVCIFHANCDPKQSNNLAKIL